MLDLCCDLENNLELARFRRSSNENLGLDVSSEISSVTDILLGLEQITAEILAGILQRLRERLVHKRPYLRREIVGDLRIWDLINLANNKPYPQVLRISYRKPMCKNTQYLYYNLHERYG